MHDIKDVKSEVADVAYLFLKEVFKNMKKYLPLNNNILTRLDCFSLKTRKDINTIKELGYLFPKIISER